MLSGIEPGTSRLPVLIAKPLSHRWGKKILKDTFKKVTVFNFYRINLDKISQLEIFILLMQQDHYQKMNTIIFKIDCGLTVTISYACCYFYTFKNKKEIICSKIDKIFYQTMSKWKSTIWSLFLLSILQKYIKNKIF